MTPTTPGLSLRTRAMATAINIQVVHPAVAGDTSAQQALAVFHDVERACSRFDPASALMQANAAPGKWHQVPRYCFEAIAEAARAHRRTGGRFDPRILADLCALGYDRTLTFANGSPALATPGGSGTTPAAAQGPRGPWRPRLRRRGHWVDLGGIPIDLGGIGKGLAVRWAGEKLADTERSFLIEAGGDCLCRGAGPDGEGWRVGIEDPSGGSGPVFVLTLADRACCTSSIRLRHWTVDGVEVHHLIDPRTGLPGGDGLASVSVVAKDPAWAEVWSKSLFLAGPGHIAAVARRRRLAALWVRRDGQRGFSPAMKPWLTWTAP